MKTTIYTIITFTILCSVTFAQSSHRFNNQYLNNVTQSHIHSSQCYQKQVQVWVPGTYEKRLVPAQYKTVQTFSSYSCSPIQKQVLVRPAFYKNVFVPGHYTTKTEIVCAPTCLPNKKFNSYGPSFKGNVYQPSYKGNKGFQKGFRKGFRNGSEKGFRKGFRNGSEKGFRKGSEKGFRNGFQRGFKNSKYSYNH